MANSYNIIPREDGGDPNPTILRIDGLHTLMVGCVKEGESGRQVSQGPLVPGPWAYAFNIGAVLTSNYKGKAEALRAEERRTIDILDGDFIRVDSNVYKVEIFDRKYINLHLQK
jgi:hypothetical protein